MTCDEAIKAIEDHVIVALDNNSTGEGWYVYTKAIARNLNIPIDWARTALRSLREKGLVEYRRGLMNEDGEVAGSGYGLTQEGRTRLESF